MHAKIPKTRFNELANAECEALYLRTREEHKSTEFWKNELADWWKCFSILTKNARKRNTNLRKKFHNCNFHGTRIKH